MESVRRGGRPPLAAGALSCAVALWAPATPAEDAHKRPVFTRGQFGGGEGVVQF